MTKTEVEPEIESGIRRGTEREGGTGMIGGGLKTAMIMGGTNGLTRDQW